MTSKPTSLALLSDLETSGALTSTSLRLPLNISAAEYEALGAMLGRLHESLKFAIGDYLREGERLFGAEAYQLQESLGISNESKMQYVRVAIAIPYERRRAELSWSHHRSVYARDPEEQEHWLDEAVKHAWSRNELDAHMRELKPAPEPSIVLEAVADAARDVYLSKSIATCASVEQFHVPLESMQNLGTALGIEDA